MLSNDCATIALNDYISKFRQSKLRYWLDNGFPSEVLLQLKLSGLDYQAVIWNYLNPINTTNDRDVIWTQSVTKQRIFLKYICSMASTIKDIDTLIEWAKIEYYQNTLSDFNSCIDLKKILKLNWTSPAVYTHNAYALHFRSLTQDSLTDERFGQSLLLLKNVMESLAERSLEITSIMTEIVQCVDKITDVEGYKEYWFEKLIKDNNNIRPILAIDIIQKNTDDGIKSHKHIGESSSGMIEYFTFYYFVSICDESVHRCRKEDKFVKKIIGPWRYKILKNSKWLVELMYTTTVFIAAIMQGNEKLLIDIFENRLNYNKSKLQIEERLDKLLTIL